MNSTHSNRWLIPFDGSAHSLHALQLAIGEARDRASAPHLMLLNVQLPLPSDVTRFISSDTVQDFHRESGEKAVQSGKELLAASGLDFSVHILVGSVASTIVEFGSSKACSMIVMGTHGHGSLAGMIMGSVTTKVLHETSLPVLLTR